MQVFELQTPSPYIQPQAIYDPAQQTVRLVVNNVTVAAILTPDNVDDFQQFLDDTIGKHASCWCCGRGSSRNGETG